MDISLSGPRYEKQFPKIVTFYNQLIERAGSIPGVRSVALFHPLPLSTDFDQTGVFIEEHPLPEGQEGSADRYIVTPAFLDAMQIPLLRGRGFAASDTLDSLPVVIVSRTMAEKFWPGEDALGKRLRLPWEPGWTPDKKMPLRTVAGIVGDIKQYGLDTPVAAQLYVPHAQYPTLGENVVVRAEEHAALPASQLGDEIRGLVRSLDPGETVWGLATYDELLADSVALRRFTMLLTGLFAGVAFLLASIGVYGVMSYLVAQRTHEMGVRVALGAQAGDVLRLVIGDGLQLAAAGTGIGIVVALASARLLASLLFSVRPTDPLTFAAAALLLVGVALAACYVPARRAMRVDPMVALRYE